MSVRKSTTLKLSLTLSACLLFSLAGCGGLPSTNHSLPASTPPTVAPTSSPATAGTPAPFNPYFNANMIGQVWTFTTDDGKCQTFVSPKAIPASNYYPAGTINMSITKPAGPTGTPCYWAATVQDAAIDFMLSPMADGSMHSPGWFFHSPDGLPSWWPCRTDPCSQEVKPSSANLPMPYMIVPPPDLQFGIPGSLHYRQVIDTGDTSYSEWNSEGQNWNDFTANAALFHAANQYWRTRFYMTDTGLAVSEQWEADCGHELWYFAPNVGLVRIESPNDGHPGGTATTCGDKFVPTISRPGPGFPVGQKLL